MLKDLLRYKPNAIYVGAVLLAAFIAFLSVAFMINRTFTLNFWDPGYQLKADFVDADGIANAADIRIAGVYVGQVTEIRSVGGGLAEITFRLDKEHSPMHQGTRANLRLQTLLGTKFIELEPGSGNSPQLDANTVIPSNKTTSPVDFDQFLSSFDKPTRDALGNLITELGTATDGRGEDINALLADLNQLSVQSAPDLQTFADRSDRINNILVNAADVTSNLSDNRQHLANVFTNLNNVLGQIADNDPAFKRFIHEGNLGLGHGITQLAGEEKNLNDTIRLLRPALQKANPTLEDATLFGRQLQSFTGIADQFTTNLLSGVSGYNADNGSPASSLTAAGPGNFSCGSATVGCGGPFLRQPTVLVQNPSDSIDCENFNPQAPACPPGSTAASSVQRSFLNFLLGR